MSVPGIVQSTLDGEEVAARVPIGGEDELFVTPTRTIVYRADGLLSNESVDTYDHDADRLTVSEGRRKARFSLEYALDGTAEFTVPADQIDDVLHPVLAGVLNGNGITDPAESVVRTYRFSELTLIVTSDRVVKHVGGAVWDGDYEGYHYDDVTGLSFEDGSVATTVVLKVDGRQQRIKAPSEDADEVGERLKRALFDYHDVGSLEELHDRVGGEDESAPARDDLSAAFGDGVDPLDADPPKPDDERGAGDAADSPADETSSRDPLADDSATTRASASDGADTGANTAGRTASDRPTADRTETASDGDVASSGATTVDASSGTETRAETGTRSGAETRASPDGNAASASTATAATDSQTDAATAAEDATSEGGFEGSGFEPATASAEGELLERLDALEATVERQTELLERQQRTIETLIEELRQGR